LKKSLVPPEGNCPQESGAYEAADSHIEMEDAFIRKEKNIIPPKAAKRRGYRGKWLSERAGQQSDDPCSCFKKPSGEDIIGMVKWRLFFTASQPYHE